MPKFREEKKSSIYFMKIWRTSRWIIFFYIIYGLTRLETVYNLGEAINNQKLLQYNIRHTWRLEHQAHHSVISIHKFPALGDPFKIMLLADLYMLSSSEVWNRSFFLDTRYSHWTSGLKLSLTLIWEITINHTRPLSCRVGLTNFKIILKLNISLIENWWRQ